jgi:hypothetical protein
MNDGIETPDTLLDRISDAFDRLPPVPPNLQAAARSAFEWRRADAALAELLFDSANDELIGVRGTAADRRSFRFAVNEFVIRVHLTPATLIVMVEPPLSVPCRVVTEEHIDELRTDEYGEVAVAAPVLPFRFEAELPNGEIVTFWITG